MKLISRILIIIALAVITAIYIVADRGQVIILLGDYRIDLSFIGLCVGIILLCILGYFLVYSLVNLILMPGYLKKWRGKKAFNQGINDLSNAWIKYFAGEFDSAYKKSMQAYTKIPDLKNKFLALMLACRSANQALDYEKERQALEKLNQYSFNEHSDKKLKIAKYMLSAQNEYATQKYGVCIDTLNLILQLDKKNIQARHMLIEVYIKLNHFDKAHIELNWLLSHSFGEAIFAQQYKVTIFRGLCENLNQIGELQQIYAKLDQRDREDKLINMYYLNALIRLEEYVLAIDLIETCTDISFLDENMVRLAKQLQNTEDAASLIKSYQKFLLTNQQNPELLLALGILSYTLKLWEDACNYIQSSILLKPTVLGYLYLSLIAEETGNSELIVKIRQGLTVNLARL